ncbi:MAG TPA: TatD family hydrolase [candidate division Zixibacteria bacterium]|nr:TatD family hydrolase [candidate division Zixibacteria bacterium]
MELIDSHAHIQGPEYAGEIEAVLERASAAGVTRVIVVGGAGELASNDAAVDLARRYPGLYATVGMHPHDAKEVGEEEFRKLERLVRGPGVVAVGETGLDYYYDHSPRAVQRKVFARFISVARRAALPLVVHERNAHRDTADLLLREGEREIRGVIHCFTGDYDAARAYLDLGFFISFSGILTFKNAGALREVARKIPLDRMLVETDSPYLTPVPHRGKRNEPSYVRLVAETVARLKETSLEEVACATTANVKKLFGI